MDERIRDFPPAWFYHAHMGHFVKHPCFLAIEARPGGDSLRDHQPVAPGTYANRVPIPT